MSSPLFFVTVFLAVGIAVGDADYIEGGHSYTLWGLGAVVCFAGAIAFWRRTARWRWAMGGACVVAFAAGWIADVLAWGDIERRQMAVALRGEVGHKGVVVSPPMPGVKALRATVELDDGTRANIFIANELVGRNNITARDLAEGDDDITARDLAEGDDDVTARDLAEGDDDVTARDLAEGDTLYEGQTLVFGARLRPVTVGGGGFALHNLRQGICASGYVTALRVVDTPAETPLMRARVWLLKRLHRLGLDRQARALGAALLLADKSGIDGGTRRAFNDAGAAHVLALSGMHLGMLMSVLLVFFGNTGRRQWVDAAVIAGVVWMYTLLAGAPLSLTRAAWLQTAFVVAIALKRRVALFDALCLAGLVMLVCSPHSLFDVGMQLSFACVSAIAVAAEWKRVYVEQVTGRVWLVRLMGRVWLVRLMGNYFVKIVATGIVCTVATIPITLVAFGRVTPYGALSGLAIIPLTTLVMATAAVAVVWPHPVVCGALSLMAGAEIAVAEWFAGLPFAVVP